MSRVREKIIRASIAALIGSLEWLQRRSGSQTTYQVNADGVAALFEGSWFIYHPHKFGATGNIDFAPDAENATRAMLFRLLKGDEVFYDIGAHGGVYTVTLRSRFPQLVVHSFEPQPEDLLANLKLNRLNTDQVHELALGSENGMVKMTVNKRSSNHIAEDGERLVRVARVDDLRAELGLPAPDWIKIDVEGFELPALKGAERTLRESKPVIICEINHVHGRFGTRVTDLVEMLASQGYKMHRLVEKRLEPVGRIRSMSDLGYSADWNFWFVPDRYTDDYIAVNWNDHEHYSRG
jgi:FkbM family methyltransferase